MLAIAWIGLLFKTTFKSRDDMKCGEGKDGDEGGRGKGGDRLTEIYIAYL